TRAHVMALHHIPIDGQQRMRGHGALLGACDTTLGVEKTAGGLRTAAIHKQNDGTEGERFAFSIDSIELSRDPETGDATTAPVVGPIEGDIPKPPPKRKLSDKQQRALEVLHNMTLEAGREPPIGLNLPAGIRVVTVEEWRAGLARHGVVDGEDANPREAFKRIRLSLS